MLNCQSVCNKPTTVHGHTIEHNLDLVALTETWLDGSEKDQKVIGDFSPPGYQFVQAPRKTTGGGIGLLHRSNIKIGTKTLVKASSFEHMEIILKSWSPEVRIIILYRPPPSAKNGLKISTFWIEFSDLLERVALLPGKVVIVGDFNLPWNKDEPATNKLKRMLDSLGYVQHVTDATQKRGNTIDLIITRSEDIDFVDVHVSSLLTDHFAIHCSLNLSKLGYPKKNISYRKVANIDKEQFKEDLKLSQLLNFPKDDLDALVDQYNTTLRGLLDQHAPLKSREVTIRPLVPWYNDEIDQAKKLRRKYERQWRMSKLTIHRQLYLQQRDKVNTLIDKAKSNFFECKIAECPDQKTLFKVVDDMLHRKGKELLPNCDSTEELVEKFSNFFHNKIAALRAELDSNTECYSAENSTTTCEAMLSEFHPVTSDDIEKLITKMPKKSCPLDPIPTWLLAEFKDEIAPIIATIINKSLATGTVPAALKFALVIPLLKKLLLALDILKNYRPVSNLPYLSKVMEKVVSEQFNTHTCENGLEEIFQSAYKPLHSTETALIRVHNDIMCSMDKRKGVILVLLDLSAAFDTIDHQILLSRLEEKVGVCGSALSWFNSYLSGRSQSVYINGIKSAPKDLKFGVPQGSLLGPKKFTMYSGPIADIARRHGLRVHMYADDTQLYLSFDIDDPLSLDEAICKIEACVKEIKEWMEANKLKLNEDKTEYVVAVAPWLRNRITVPELVVGEEKVTATTHAKNLGVIFDQCMNMDKHINSVCRSARFHLRNIGSIRNCLTTESLLTLVHAFISSRLDNGNALLFGVDKKSVKKLQHIQNIAARLVTGTRKQEHITPVLKMLHWLPVEQRIQYKILLITYKCLNNLAPLYLSELIQKHIPTRQLRSKSKNLLVVPKYNLETYGKCSFSFAGPYLWNTLPDSLRVHMHDHKGSGKIDAFKKKLKTYLFDTAFN